MVIQLDRSYKINFKTEEDGAGADFSVLDGFYEVVRSYGWNELNASGIDLQESLLDHAGIADKTAIRTLQQNWANDAFYYCIGMDKDRQIWVPESIIKGYPDPRIGSYKKLMLTIDLGVFANPEDFSTMGKEIMNYLRSNYGIDRPDGIVAAYGNQWMTVKEYEETDSRRQAGQGLVYVQTQTAIPAGDHTGDEYILVFNDPPNGEEIPENVRYLGAPPVSDPTQIAIVGAFSDTIRISYDGFEYIPYVANSGNNPDEPCWYYNDTTLSPNNNNGDVLINNYTIETALNKQFTGTVLHRIRLKPNFTKPFYVWKNGDGGLIFTKSNNPKDGDGAFSDRTLLNEIGVIESFTDQSVTVTLSSSNSDVVYNYYTAANQVLITIGYRCRQINKKTRSSYSDALNYAYANLELKQRIAALEEMLTQQNTGDLNA